MEKNIKVVFTGGGTSGHVTPNIALIKALKEKGSACFYIGSTTRVERDLIEPLDIPFFSVRTGKLRRYFSFRTFLEPFQILIGIIQAYSHLTKIKPNLVFSKGGFVAFPVVVAAFFKKIPVIAHESDLTPGLANKLSFPFCQKILVTFKKAKDYFKNKNKVFVTGTPIRKELFLGDKEKAKALCGFEKPLPTLLVMGGGQGSVFINQAIRAELKALLEKFNIIHLCGQGKVDDSINQKGYAQFAYLQDELADCMALSDLVISRSGANSVYEVLALKKPHIFIPLSLKASRGDQIHNANYFKEQGVSKVLDEETLTAQTLNESIDKVFQDKDNISQKINALSIDDATNTIIDLIYETAK